MLKTMPVMHFIKTSWFDEHMLTIQQTGDTRLTGFKALILTVSTGFGIMRFVINEEDVVTVMKHPAVVIGTDAMSRCSSGPLSRGKPHPRGFGTFPRILSKYVHDEGILSIEEAIAKMTGRTAEILSFSDRGLLRNGYHADVVIFDPEEIADTATFAYPISYPRGIKNVIVNGKVVVEDGCLADTAKPGKVLRR